MMAATSEMFKDALLKSAEDTLDNFILTGVPHVFRKRPRGYDEVKMQLANELGVDPRQIRIVGSGHLGFCGKRDEFGRKFKPDSDIDTVVVSERLFDTYWHSLLKWHSSSKWSVPFRFRDQAVEHHQQSIYWGHMWPDLLIRSKVLKIKENEPSWSSIFRSLSDIPELSPYDVKGRLYRTWEHVKTYHLDSLRWLRADMLSKGSAK